MGRASEFLKNYQNWHLFFLCDFLAWNFLIIFTFCMFFSLKIISFSLKKLCLPVLGIHFLSLASFFIILIFLNFLTCLARHFNKMVSYRKYYVYQETPGKKTGSPGISTIFIGNP